MHPKVRLTLSNGKKIELELYEDVAPISVENFLKYVEAGFYSGTFFHRIIENFMVQGGGFCVDGRTVRQKAPLYPPIKGEFLSNGVKNDIKHVLGVISMARTSDKNSGTSQFFLCSAAAPHLDGEYAAFGKAVDEEGIQAILELEKSPTGRLGYMGDFPLDPVFIEKAEVIKR